VVIAAVLLRLQRMLLGRRRFTVVGGQAAGRHLISLGRWRYPVAAALGVFILVSVVLPLAAIVLTSLIRAYGLPPIRANLTLQHYATVFLGVPKVHRAIVNSLGLAAASATLIVVLAAGLGYLLTRVRIRGAAFLELLITIPYAVPGTVVALAMILAWVRPVPVLGIRLYDTIWILLIAYVARFLVFGVRTVMAGLAQVHESLEEAARISGAGRAAAFRDIVNGAYEHLIEQGIQQGTFRVTDAREGASVVRAMIDGLFLQWLQEADWETLHPQLREVCKRAVLAYLRSGQPAGS
jgi:iron(III) transport system permease protein